MKRSWPHEINERGIIWYSPLFSIRYYRSPRLEFTSD